MNPHTAPGAWLATGSSGFIGAALLQRLRAQAPQQPLWLAGRHHAAPPAHAAWRAWPLDLAAPTLALPEGVHTVLHLAGEKRDAARMPAINHAAALRLVEAAARAGAQRFVHLSSVGVYGAPRHAGVVTEAFAHTPRGAYETSKDAGEHAVRERCAALGLACVVLQPSNVVGVVGTAEGTAGGLGDGKPPRSLPLLGLVRMVARGWFCHFGQRPAWVNYVAVEDVAAALLAAARHGGSHHRHGHGGTYIVNTPAPLAQFVAWVADELQRLAPTRRLPWWLGAAAAGAGELGGKVLRRTLPFDRARFGELTNTTRYDGTALQRGLAFAYPLGIEATMRALTRQYRALGLV